MRGGAGEERDVSYAAAFVCDAFAGIGNGYPDVAGFAGAFGCDDDDDLHACDAEAGNWGKESAGSGLGVERGERSTFNCEGRGGTRANIQQ